jgi:A/G-specific adenine glycosylase
MMLQQTQVETVIPYYRRFLARFPSVNAVAEARADEVLKLWENLGYYSRARHLHAAAKKIVARWGSRLPQTRKDLMTLPGIGEYTAAAILSIAFDQCVPAIDGNVSRVISRLFALRNPLGSSESRQHVRTLADQLVSKRNPGHFNQALMDLGATICTPRNPSCVSCPLRGLCKAKELGLQERLPVAKKRPLLSLKHMTAGIILDRKEKVLMVRDPPRDFSAVMEIPGGRGCERNGRRGLARTVPERTQLSIRVGKKVASVRHAYTHFRVTFHVSRCTIQRGRPKSPEGRRWDWVPVEKLRRLALSKAERKILDILSHS